MIFLNRVCILNILSKYTKLKSLSKSFTFMDALNDLLYKEAKLLESNLIDRHLGFICGIKLKLFFSCNTKVFCINEKYFRYPSMLLPETCDNIFSLLIFTPTYFFNISDSVSINFEIP